MLVKISLQVICFFFLSLKFGQCKNCYAFAFGMWMNLHVIVALVCILFFLYKRNFTAVFNNFNHAICIFPHVAFNAPFCFTFQSKNFNWSHYYLMAEKQKKNPNQKSAQQKSDPYIAACKCIGARTATKFHSRTYTKWINRFGCESYKYFNQCIFIFLVVPVANKIFRNVCNWISDLFFFVFFCFFMNRFNRWESVQVRNFCFEAYKHTTDNKEIKKNIEISLSLCNELNSKIRRKKIQSHLTEKSNQNNKDSFVFVGHFPDKILRLRQMNLTSLSLIPIEDSKTRFIASSCFTWFSLFFTIHFELAKLCSDLFHSYVSSIFFFFLSFLLLLSWNSRQFTILIYVLCNWSNIQRKICG